MFQKKFKILIIFLFFVAGFFVAINFGMAQEADVGLEFGEETGLGNEDPRVIVANIIRVILGFLGIIAVILIMYAGWLYTTSAGNEEKISQAKKILIGAVIGLVIALSAFAIASFILSRLLSTTTGGSGNNFGGGNFNTSSGTGTSGGGGFTSCNSNVLSSVCEADPSACSGDEYCNTSCFCETKSEYGESCNSDSGTVCEANEDMCSGYLECDDLTCTCLGDPVIEWISPVDDTDTPNGAVGNIITISGLYFGNEVGEVYFWDSADDSYSSIPASFPDEVNPECTSFWQDDQIIVVVPEGATDGPIKVISADLREDTTDDERPWINDFIVNDIVRPGLCLVSPEEGYFEDVFTIQGISLDGVEQNVLFGNSTSNTSADNIGIWSNTSISASIPNINPGKITVFTNIDGLSSNYLRFDVLSDSFNNPVIEYIDPSQGPEGQYITIYGRNFKSYNSALSTVKFYSEISGELTPAKIDFPQACQGKWWKSTFITVKVPGVDIDKYKIIITNKDGRASAPADFRVTDGKPSPGLCLLDPNNGPVGTPVSAYGDGFKNAQGDGKIVFYNNKEGQIAVSGWADQSIKTSVPFGAQTGPLEISRDGDVSNSLPFKVGACSSNEECDIDANEECCGSGTWAGVCRDAGSCDAVGPNDCEFGWTFSTSLEGSEDYCIDSEDCCIGLDCKKDLGDARGVCGGCRVEIDGDASTMLVEEREASNLACQCSGSSKGCILDDLDDLEGHCDDLSEEEETCSEDWNCIDGLSCDPITNTCQPDTDATGVAGESCEIEEEEEPSCVDNCVSNYKCLSGADDCLCCCDPNGPSNSEGLECVKNNFPCDGDNRGLFCGGTYDSQCGDSTLMGLGYDTCCRARPEVLPSVHPSDGSSGVCRNTLISARFNTPMDITSFSGNVIVVGDYGEEQCPKGTNYLVLGEKNNLKNKIKNWLSKIPFVNKLFTDNVSAADSKNYCAITGTVDGHNEGIEGVLNFRINQALDAGIEYHVIIKGDEDINDENAEGVLSSYEVGMNGEAEKVFNAITYGGYIWSFTTGSKVCQLNSVSIIPDSYLFTSSENNIADDGQSFEVVPPDNDKLFVSKAVSINGQYIESISGYAWDWSWESDNTSVATIEDASPPPSQTIVRAQNKDDSKTYINATATIIEDSIINPSTQGQERTSRAQVYILLCENPWPPIESSSRWEPWGDEADDCQDSNCYNYELYYCRDAGGVGTQDDLPAILGDDVVKRENASKDILKEFYFLREEMPDATNLGLEVFAQPDGGKVYATWNDVGAEDYKLYYGTSPENYSDFIDILASTTKMVFDLENGIEYWFAVTAYYNTGAESEYSESVSSGILADSIPPSVVSGLSAIAGDSEVDLTWDKNTDDTVSYNVYYGTSSGVYGGSQNVGDMDGGLVTGLTNGVEYYFVVTALDIYGNESGKVGEVRGRPIN